MIELYRLNIGSGSARGVCVDSRRKSSWPNRTILFRARPLPALGNFRNRRRMSVRAQGTKTNRHRHVRLAAAGAATTTTTTTGNKVDHAINYIAAGTHTHTPTHLILIYDGSKEQQWESRLICYNQVFRRVQRSTWRWVSKFPRETKSKTVASGNLSRRMNHRDNFVKRA